MKFTGVQKQGQTVHEEQSNLHIRKQTKHELTKRQTEKQKQKKRQKDEHTEK